MNTYKIRLKDGDTVGAILRLFTEKKNGKFILECPSSFSLVSDTAFLKRVKKTALENESKVLFVVRRKVLRDIIASQKIEVFSKWGDIEDEGEILDLDTIFGKTEAKKNKPTEDEEQKEKEAEEQKEAGEEEVELSPLFSRHRIENTGFERSLRSHVFFGFLLVMMLLGFLFYWISPSATISVKPKISLVPLTQNMIVKVGDTVIPDSDQQLPVIDAIFVETEEEGEETFPAGDLQYEVTNAKGKITLFNETQQEKFLVPSRLQSPDGSIFRFAEEITIPARTDEGPGTLVVEIEADSFIDEDPNQPIGSKGNIDAGTELVFPALSDELKENFYGKANKGPLVGGSTLTRYFVQQSDFDRAEEEFRNIFRTRGIEDLTEEIETRSEREGRTYAFINDPRLMKASITEINYPEELLGLEQQTFSVSGKVRIFGVVFDETKILEFLEDRMRKTQDKRKKLIKIDPSSIEYRILDAEKLEEEGWVKLSISVAGIESLAIEDDAANAFEWRQNLIGSIQKKSIREARAILLNDPEIDSVIKIKISPFWIRRLPSIEDQIKFKSVEVAE